MRRRNIWHDIPEDSSRLLVKRKDKNLGDFARELFKDVSKRRKKGWKDNH